MTKSAGGFCGCVRAAATQGAQLAPYRHGLAAARRVRAGAGLAQSALTLSQSFDDRVSAACSELTLGQIELDAGRCTPAGEHCRRSLAVALETGEHPLHIRSLVALARIERLLGHPAAARRRLEEAVSACTQPEIAHSNQLAAVALELGHVAGAEQDWLQARQRYAEALAAKGHSAAEAQDALAGLAEVAWAENDGALGRTTAHAGDWQSASAAATRQRAEQLLMGWGMAAVAADHVCSHSHIAGKIGQPPW